MAHRTTRRQADLAEFKHVLTVLIDYAEDEKPYCLVAEHHKYVNVRQLALMEPEELDEVFDWTDPDDQTQKQVELSTAEKKDLTTLIQWLQEEPLNLWVNLTDTDFKHYCSLCAKRRAPTPVTPVPPTTTSTTVPSTSSASSFHYMKRDLGQFKKINQRYNWKDWSEKTKLILEGQGISNPFDDTYSPSTPDEQKQYKIDNGYLYTILEQNVQFATGRKFIGKVTTGDGKTLWKALQTDATSTIVLETSADELEKKLRAMSADRDLRNGTYEHLLDSWETRLTQLEQVRSTAPSDLEKKNWLSATLRTDEVTKAIMEHQEQISIQIREAVPTYVQTFDSWLKGIRIGCMKRDQANLASKDDKKKTRKVNMSEQERQKDTARREEQFKKNKERLQSIGMWVEPSTFAKWSKEKKIEHRDSAKKKLKELEKRKANTGVTDSAGGTEVPTQVQTPTDDDLTIVTQRTNMTQTSHGVGSMNASLDNTNSNNNSNPQQGATPSNEMLTYKGKLWRVVNAARSYHVHEAQHEGYVGSLVDGGCNGGLAGSDVRILETDTNKSVDVHGIGDKIMKDVPLCTAAGIVNTDNGPIILKMHQYAGYGKGQMIHSPTQIRNTGILIDDTPSHHRRIDGEFGTQRIVIPGPSEDYTIRLHFNGGLPYFKMRPPTDDELDNEDIPHINFTSDCLWDPSRNDTNNRELEQVDLSAAFRSTNYTDMTEFDDMPKLGFRQVNLTDVIELEYGEDDDDDTIPDLVPRNDRKFDDDSSYGGESALTDDTDDEPSIRAFHFVPSIFKSIAHEVQAEEAKKEGSVKTFKTYVEQKFNKTIDELRPHFAWATKDRIKATTEATTQYFKANEWSQRIKRHFKSRFPGANVIRRNEPVASDSVWMEVEGFADGIPGHGGALGFQLFHGVESKHNDVYFIKTDAEFPTALRENIRQHGAPTYLRTDHAKAEMSGEVKTILRDYAIKDGQSEPYYQNQNPCEREVQRIKPGVQRLMDITNTPYEFWPLALRFYVDLDNHISRLSLNDRTPLEKKTGQIPDISKYLHFRWWEPVYYLDADGKEQLGRWCGPAEHVGDELTYHVLTGDTLQVVPRSDIRTATDPNLPNLRADAKVMAPIVGEDEEADENGSEFFDEQELNGPARSIPPGELVGRHILRPNPDTGLPERTEIVRRLKNKETETEKQIRFLVKNSADPDQTVEDIMDYNEICDLVEQQMEALDSPTGSEMHTFKGIAAHVGPLSPRHSDYKGSSYNLLIEWDNGEQTWEPLHLIAKDDPITCAIYAKENNLLKTKGWQRFKKYARKIKKVIFQVKRLLCNKKKQKRGPKFKYGVRLPDFEKSFMELDKENGNTLWADARNLEIELLDQYEVFEDTGLWTTEKEQELLREGYQKIQMLMVWDCKSDGRHRARCVAMGNQTRPDVEDTYSTVVSLRTLRLALLLGELNNLKLMVGDISSAYLMAWTKEKVFFVGGPEFGKYEGHLMIVRKAQYGLRGSGKHWHDLFHSTMRAMGFFPSKADPDVWIRDAGDCYEYVCNYVDDVTAIMKDPEAFFAELELRGYGLKGVTTDPDVFLGGSVARDPDGTLVWGAKSYIQRALDNFEREMGSKPAPQKSPLPEKVQPEMDTSPILDEKSRAHYQSLIGTLQWCVTLGRFDIAYAVMTMSRFRSEPRKRHLELVVHTLGYLRKYPDGMIRFRTGIPNHEQFFGELHLRNWKNTVYDDSTEEIPPDAPPPKGKPVRQSCWFDANLLHCMATGKSAMGTFHTVNQTPVHFQSKRQSTVETSTFASELIAQRTCCDEAATIRYELRMLGAPLDGPVWQFGDNKSVIDSTANPAGRLKKRHLLLSWHKVREYVSTHFLCCFHIDTHSNISDCLTKALGHTALWRLIKPVLFWKGDTEECNKQHLYETKQSSSNPHPSGECQDCTDLYSGLTGLDPMSHSYSQDLSQ